EAGGAARDHALGEHHLERRELGVGRARRDRGRSRRDRAPRARRAMVLAAEARVTEQPAEPPKQRGNPGPSRPAFSRRTRLGLMLVLGVAFITAVIVGALLASTSSAPKGKLVTIPVADRSASKALLDAAAAVNFQPANEAGTGTVEDDPL